MADKENEKRMIEGYEVTQSIQLAGGEVIFAEKKGEEQPYLVCDNSWENAFGIDEYKNGIVGDDFAEMMREFSNRLAARLDTVEAERARRGIPVQTLTAADCEPKGMDTDMEGRVVVIKPESLSRECRTIDYQLALCTGGFGSRPNSRGRAVFCTNLYTGKNTQWDRTNIAGTISPERLPDWALEKLADLQKPAEKESVVDKIRQGKQQTDTPQKTKHKTHKQDGPEH